MISIDVKFLRTQKHGAKLFKGFNNRKKLFLHGGVIMLSWYKLARIEGNWFTMLHDH